jgi:hypothetical protein
LEREEYVSTQIAGRQMRNRFRMYWDAFTSILTLVYNAVGYMTPTTLELISLYPF